MKKLTGYDTVCTMPDYDELASPGIVGRAETEDSEVGTEYCTLYTLNMDNKSDKIPIHEK